MDEFFSQKNCDRCGCDLKHGRIMSKFNEDCICMDCSEKEKLDKDYDAALKAEHEEIKKGNFNYAGIRSSKNNLKGSKE